MRTWVVTGGVADYSYCPPIAIPEEGSDLARRDTRSSRTDLRHAISEFGLEARASGDKTPDRARRKERRCWLNLRKSIQLARYAGRDTTWALLRPRPPRLVGKAAWVD